MSSRRGFTVMEAVIVIAVIAILASAFSSVIVPMMNSFFYYPESSRVNNAAADVLDIIIEGDKNAKGLRFAGLPCAPYQWLTSTAYVVGDYVQQGGLNYYCLVNHTSGVFATDLAAARWLTTTAWAASTSYSVGNYVSYGAYNYTCVSAHTSSAAFATDLAAGRWINSTITTATASTLTYNYALSDACGAGGKNNNSVTISYDSVNHIVTRSINGSTPVAIPYYATSASGIKIDAPSGVNFFRYYNSASTGDTSGELGSSNAAAARVDITVLATSGSGQVKHDAGQILLKSGVEIKRYTT